MHPIARAFPGDRPARWEGGCTGRCFTAVAAAALLAGVLAMLPGSGMAQVRKSEAAAPAGPASASASAPSTAASSPAASGPAEAASAPAVPASSPSMPSAPAPAASAPAAPPPAGAASTPAPAGAASTPAPAAVAPAPAPAASPASAPEPARAGTAAACPPALDMRLPTRGQDRGLLWRISRGGQVSYLYGTVHVGKPAWQVLGPVTAGALRAADTLALEVDPTDPAVLAALEDKTPAPPLPEDLKKRLVAATERACVPLMALAALHPVLQATTLTVLDARWLGLDPNHSVEMQLVQRAKAQRKRVVSLETVDQQKQALVPTDAAEAVAMIEQTLDQLDSLVSRRVLERMVRAWERGDLEALERYEEWCECAATEDDRAYLRRLNDERNVPLADRIAALHGQGRRLFAAVGALHMTGPAALPRLLAERGFLVERVILPPPASGAPKSRR